MQTEQTWEQRTWGGLTPALLALGLGLAGLLSANLLPAQELGVSRAGRVLGMTGLLAGLCLFCSPGGVRWCIEGAVRSFVRLFYRVEIEGLEHIPRRTGAVVIANHVSYVDGLLLAMSVPRPMRFLMHRMFYRAPLIGPVARLFGVIPVASGDPRSTTRASLQRAVAAAKRGELVCLFPEGKISRNGQLDAFKRGLERIAGPAGVPIVPVAIRGLYGSLFSFSGGRALWKRPRQIAYPVHLRIGAPLASNSSAQEARAAVQELLGEATTPTRSKPVSLIRRFVESARRHKGRTALVDGTGVELTYGRLLVGSLAMKHALGRELGEAQNVGVFLPPGAGGVLANLALAMDGKVPVNLNYTMTGEQLAEPIEQAGLAQIITARKFLEALGVPSPLPEAQTIYLEDVKASLRLTDKLRAVVQSKLPAGMLDPVRDPQETATIIFSSGSTARPKGVVLSHANILANADAIGEVFAMQPEDVKLGILPFFHSFGFTATIWLPLLAGSKVVYHANPLDVKTIGKLAKQHGVTLMLATPTFYQAYMRRLDPEVFAKVRFAVTGAEKLRDSLNQAWQEKFGFELYEGYGCTELSPVVSVNCKDLPGAAPRSRRGSVGLPLPGVSLRVVDPDDPSRERPQGEQGLLMVKGPNVMQGYLGNPGLTAEVLKDGWYCTGDIARIDGDGFLFLTDRLSRFSKIGGEMVPHGKVEEALQEQVDALCIACGEVPAEEDAEGPRVAITSLPDEQKGERLVVLYTPLTFSISDAIERLSATGMTKLFIPRAKNCVEVPTIPQLGSGKTDLKGLRTLAEDRLTS